MLRRLLRLALCLALTANAANARPEPSDAELSDEAWRTLRERRFGESVPAFDAALARLPESEALAFGSAVALLTRQPRSRQNIARADAWLAELATRPDELGLQARYLRARVAELHLFEPDPALAARRYEELVALAPEHPLAQAAVPKLVRQRIYQLGHDPLIALADAESWAEVLTAPDARRDFHQVMARSHLFFKSSPETALRHLLATREAGQHIPAGAASTLASIGELARELGQTATARAAYRAFLENHPRDQRVHMIRQRLAELGSTESTASTAPTAPASAPGS